MSILQDAELLLAHLLARIGNPSTALQLLQSALPTVLEQGSAALRASICLLLGKCELLVSQQQPQGSPTAVAAVHRAVKWLERSKLEWMALAALSNVRETAYMLVRAAYEECLRVSIFSYVRRLTRHTPGILYAVHALCCCSHARMQRWVPSMFGSETLRRRILSPPAKLWFGELFVNKKPYRHALHGCTRCSLPSSIVPSSKREPDTFDVTQCTPDA